MRATRLPPINQSVNESEAFDDKFYDFNQLEICLQLARPLLVSVLTLFHQATGYQLNQISYQSIYYWLTETNILPLDKFLGHVEILLKLKT